MIIVVMGIEDKVELEALGIECCMDRFDFRGIDRGRESTIGIVNQIAVVIGKTGNLVDFKAALWFNLFDDR